MMTLVARASVVLATVSLLASSAVAGTISGVAGRPIGDAITWSSQGVELDLITGGSTTGGNAFTLSGGAAFTLLAGSTYNADFLPTDMVLSVFDPGSGPLPGDIRIQFASPVRAAGAQVQINSFGTPFTVVMEAFGLGGVSFGTVSLSGSVNNPSLGDGSALFVGLRSTLTDIYAIRFSTGTDGMAINDVSLSYTGEVVPEPASGLLLVAAAGGYWLVSRRRRS